MKKKKITKLHLSLISLALLFGIFLGLLPVYFKTTQHVSAASPNKPVVGIFTVPVDGVHCTTPTETHFGIQFCILSQVALSNPPTNLNCSWSVSGTGDPTLDNIWHNCYANGEVSSAEYGPFGLPGASGTDVFWKNGNLEFGLQQNGGISFGGGTITVVYSATSQ